MNLDFNKGNGLIPAVIQDNSTGQVLMLGYLNQEAYDKTRLEKRVTFFSRTKNRLWTKGESSGNFLDVIEMVEDCDRDALLIKVTPRGPTCHTGMASCFGPESKKGFIFALEKTIDQRIENDDPNSYTNKLFKRGINKMAQKVGEEAVELVIEAKDENKELFLNEAADLLYHLLILLKGKGVSFEEVESVLWERAQ